MNLHILEKKEIEERLEVCKTCEHKTPDWLCSLTEANLLLKTEYEAENCPIFKWKQRHFFGHLPEPPDIKINNIVKDIFEPEEPKNSETEVIKLKDKLIDKPQKGLLKPSSSIEDIIYCVFNYPPGNWPTDSYKWENFREAYRFLSKKEAEKLQLSEYPADRFNGRGIIICGGGPKYFPSLYVNIKILRMLGSRLPVEVYYLGPMEMDYKMISLLEELPLVKCIDGRELEKIYPIRIHAGWESKVYAIINCRFEEVLMLDADNTPLVNPDFIFEDKAYIEKGAILWPDFACWRHDRNMWNILGMPYRDELQIESGQALVNKKRSWAEINMALYYCNHSDYYFKMFYGDKEAFHFGWRILGGEYYLPQPPGWINDSIILQHAPDGSWLFGHRAQAKFRLDKTHKITHDFPYEQDTLELLDELNKRWTGNIWQNNNPSTEELELIDNIKGKLYLYKRVGIDEREMKLDSNNTITSGSARLEKRWYIYIYNGQKVMSITGDEGPICILKYNEDKNIWEGKWLKYERCDIHLSLIV